MLSPEGQGHRVLAHELAADDEGLGQPLRAAAAPRTEAHAELAAVAEQPLEARPGRAGVVMTRISRMPASISVDSG